MHSCEGFQAVQRVCKLRGEVLERAEGRGDGNTAPVPPHGLSGGDHGAYVMLHSIAFRACNIAPTWHWREFAGHV